MARVEFTTPTAVYKGIIERLIATIHKANETTCFLSLDPDIKPPMPGQFFYVVTPPSCVVDQPNFEGGGTNHIELRQIFLVTINSTVQLDQPAMNTQFLTNTTLGIWEEWVKVMATLSDYELLDADGNEILCEPIRPTEAAPEHRQRAIGTMQTGFEICYDLDISNVLVT